jgi:hypothetical protein
MLALGGCAADLPQAPPPADATPPPGLFTLSPGTPVDGTVRIAAGRGGRAAGTLDTNGQRLRFTVSGLTGTGARIGPLASGEVYGLQRSGDFAGTFRDVGGAASDLGGVLRLGNDNLVLMVLRPARPGVTLSVPPGGATVTVVR